MVGGGVRGKVAGIGHIIITGGGLIITMFQTFIMMCPRIGEDPTKTVLGTGTGGIISGFLTMMFKRTGRDGRITDIGKGKEPGVSKAINLYRSRGDRKLDAKGKSNINGSMRFSNISETGVMKEAATMIVVGVRTKTEAMTITEVTGIKQNNWGHDRNDRNRD
jgi:hypothetical protein